MFLPLLFFEWQQWVIHEHINEEIINTYSVMGAIGVIGQTNHIGGENALLSTLTLAFVVCAPILRAFFGILLWFTPLRSASQRAFAGIIDYLSVVAAADVFGVSAYIMVWQLPKIYANMEEAAEYMTLTMNSCIGLYVFTLAGFLETFVSKAIHERYLETVKAEGEQAVKVGGSGVVDLEAYPPVAAPVPPRP